MSRITIDQVAREAGVSVSTASRVLNRVATPINISEATAERVQRAASALGYVPSGAARMMRTGRSRTLGVLGTDSLFFRGARSSSFVGLIFSALVESAAREGYHLSLLTGFQPESPVRGGLSDLGMADGLIVLNRDLANEPPETTAALAGWPRPLVYLLDYCEEDTDAWTVAPDDREGGRLATRALLEAGHRGVAFVRKAYFPNIFDRRAEGWRLALRDADLSDGMGQDLDVDALTPDALRERIRGGVTGFVCANNVVANQLLRLATEAGLRVPGDLAVVRFGHHEPEPDPRFAEVTHDLTGEVSLAVRLLVRLIESGSEGVPDEEAAGRRRLFPYRFRHGDTFPPTNH